MQLKGTGLHVFPVLETAEPGSVKTMADGLHALGDEIVYGLLRGNVCFTYFVHHININDGRLNIRFNFLI